MCRIHAALTQLMQDEKGAAASEYGLTAALLAVVLILAAGLLGGSLGATFGGVASSFSTGPFGTGLSSNGQAVPAAGTSFCERPPQPFLPASPGSSCQPSVSGPAVTVGAPAVAG
jgi:pilus assembly protein Flp/PilA